MPRSPAILLPLGAALSTALGVGIGAPWLFPFLGAAIPIPVFLKRIREGRPSAAFGWVLYWCVAQSLAVGLAVAIAPERTLGTVWRGPEYTQEMLHYIRTGEGPEGSPELFLPMHARHYALMCIVSLTTIGTGGLVMGTALLNYMNVYVSELVRMSTVPALALAFGWPIWAVIRVVGYVATGAALADLSWSLWHRRRKPEPVGRRPPYRLLVLGVVLVLLDLALKALLAPIWRGVLLRSLGHS